MSCILMRTQEHNLHLIFPALLDQPPYYIQRLIQGLTNPGRQVAHTSTFWTAVSNIC
jgi:hypothetical protein